MLGCCWYHKGTNFQANHNVRYSLLIIHVLLLIPQRYEFSSKSQHYSRRGFSIVGCCWYHKGTNFQANHNPSPHGNPYEALLLIPQRYEFSSKSQLRQFLRLILVSCCWYHKGTNFQANHNISVLVKFLHFVVADTTKVRIFKQITTWQVQLVLCWSLLLIPQRYEFSSKSQHSIESLSNALGCCWYHKGTNFQANHNRTKIT